MNPQTWWYIARASGIVAWCLLSLSVISGLLASTRLMRGRPKPAWLADVHRYLAGSAVVFTGMHVVGLVADSYVHFGLAEVLVPFRSPWRPVAVAMGVVALYLVVAVEVSSLLMRRLPRATWRAIHSLSYLLFWSATFHYLLAGTDTANVIARWSANVAMAIVVFLSLVRFMTPRSGSRRASAARRPHPVRS